METTVRKEATTLFESLSAEELLGVKTVLGAYRSFRGPRRDLIGYISMPITSGRRLNNLLVKNNVRYLVQLAEKCGNEMIYEEVIKPNIKTGVAFVDERGAIDHLLYIAPSVFEAKKWRWSQDAYMALWYQVIAEMAGRHILMDGWQYSTGCVHETYFSLLLQQGAIKSKDLAAAKHCFEMELISSDAYNKLDNINFPKIEEQLREISKITIHDEDNQTLTTADVLIKLSNVIYELVEFQLPYKDLLGPALGIICLPDFLHNFREVGVWTLADEGEADYNKLQEILERGQQIYGEEVIGKLRAGCDFLHKRKTGGYPTNVM